MLRRPDFTKCFDNGRRYFSRHFVLFALPREDDEAWRLGLAVTRKAGSAPRRNRIKRVVREFFRLHQDIIDAPFDFIVVPKKNLQGLRVSLALVTEELLPLLRRIQSGAKQKHGASAV